MGLSTIRGKSRAPKPATINTAATTTLRMKAGRGSFMKRILRARASRCKLLSRGYFSGFLCGWGGFSLGANCGDLPPRNSRRKSSFDLNVRPANCP